jgi:prevent-host-death family protein
MRQRKGERKQHPSPQQPAPTSDEVTMVVARDLLGDIVSRARLMGTRTILSRNGKRVAAIVPIADYERLTA